MRWRQREFHVAVESIQRNQGMEKQQKSGWIKTTYSSSTLNRPDQDTPETSDTPESGIKPLECLDQEKHFSMHTASITVAPTTHLFSELDPALRKLLSLAGRSEADLQDRDPAELIYGIINRLGGLEAVRREMKNRGVASKTLSRATGASSTLGLRKGPLPPVPSISPQHASTAKKTLSLPPWIPPPPSVPPPPAPERIKKSASFKPVGSASAAESDLILTALRDAFR
ncbi:uncharacterized protein LOC115359539 [Myripristis murdjan]|uniref:uncharacterized protein LOC115359539 n=1 Tax=Myripristis murdjan TaxID=586833 RepID=UPI00117634B2|nr:uncharacterized protein LOC115359539 [Myripristis murdjan]XP_029907940.1 uncharacterized protein LOC115359539 [Myripristis murdjan]